jgi:RNA polymerase sigma factor (sigma-70 family)
METGDALEVAFERHYEGLFRVALLVTGSAQEAEDVVQESLLKVRDRLPLLADDEVRPYLRATVVNEWRDRVRRERRFAARMPLLWPQRSESTPFEERDELWSLVLRLPPRQRACLVLRFYEDLPLAEMAHVMECSVGTVKSQLHRAVEAVRKGRDDADR